MKKYKIIHIPSGLTDIWEAESVEDIQEILKQGKRKIMHVRGNDPYELSPENTVIEEVHE